MSERAADRLGRRAGITAGLTMLPLLAACTANLPTRVMTSGASEPPVIASNGGERTANLSVLTYNIEGLPWPARRDRGAQLRAIGERLAQLRREGRAPDVVMFQEVFSGAAARAVRESGYPALAAGPGRLTPAERRYRDKLPGRASLKRGEFGLRLSSSGLVVASRYPILAVERTAFGRRSCAGLDCLANKGVMLARIQLPGVPSPIDLYNTHMNSREASRAPGRRNLAAHGRQAQEVSAFVDRSHDDAFPMVLGGDFNMRHSDRRWAAFSQYQSLTLVHRACLDPRSGCEVRMSWDGDAPWMDTQDLQFFWSGARVAIRPIRVEAMFDGGASGPVLSDHDGFLVTYRLSWSVEGASSAPHCPG